MAIIMFLSYNKTKDKKYYLLLIFLLFQLCFLTLRKSLHDILKDITLNVDFYWRGWEGVYITTEKQ